MARESVALRAEQRARQWLVHGRVLTGAELVARIDAVDERAIADLRKVLLAGPPTLATIGPDDRMAKVARRHLAQLVAG